MHKILKIFKKVKIRTLLVLIVLLSFNSYAWFVYATKVSLGLSAHISSWNVMFQAGEEETSTNVSFTVDRVYPGMETFTKQISATNNGEVKARLEYQIKSVTIFNTKYEQNETTTSDDLLNRIQTYYPFHIYITVDNEEIAAENGKSTFTISFEWPYESGNDHEDTVWGEEAYEFYSTNPGENSIIVEMELKAIQETTP